jgi:aspartyl-tRNA(Asn)/glutamyl-tRNA(Gln) amidotransferase subunit B
MTPVRGKLRDLQPCGHEVHTRLKTATKIFCACSRARFGDPRTPALLVPQPAGSLPVLNRRAQGRARALSLNLRIQQHSRFALKYFYPDIPGLSDLRTNCRWRPGPGNQRAPRRSASPGSISEDAAKTYAKVFDSIEGNYIDYNRWAALAEIVSEPDLRSPTEATHAAP